MNKEKNKKYVYKIAFIFILLNLFYLIGNGSRLVYKAGGKSFESYISNSSYYAMQRIYDENIDFSMMYSVITNQLGDIVMVNTNTQMVNFVANKLALVCYDYMEQNIQSGFNIPIGAFSGLNILAGSGPTVKVKLLSVLSVECKIQRTLESAGINQTRQTLSAIIHTEITVFSLFKSRNYIGDIEMLLYDNLIVGNVPESYFTAEIVGESIKKG